MSNSFIQQQSTLSAVLPGVISPQQQQQNQFSKSNHSNLISNASATITTKPVEINSVKIANKTKIIQEDGLSKNLQ